MQLGNDSNKPKREPILYMGHVPACYIGKKQCWRYPGLACSHSKKQPWQTTGWHYPRKCHEWLIVKCHQWQSSIKLNHLLELRHGQGSKCHCGLTACNAMEGFRWLTHVMPHRLASTLFFGCMLGSGLYWFLAQPGCLGSYPWFSMASWWLAIWALTVESKSTIHGVPAAFTICAGGSFGACLGYHCWKPCGCSAGPTRLELGLPYHGSHTWPASTPSWPSNLFGGCTWPGSSWWYGWLWWPAGTIWSGSWCCCIRCGWHGFDLLDWHHCLWFLLCCRCLGSGAAGFGFCSCLGNGDARCFCCTCCGDGAAGYICILVPCSDAKRPRSRADWSRKPRRTATKIPCFLPKRVAPSAFLKPATPSSSTGNSSTDRYIGPASRILRAKSSIFRSRPEQQCQRPGSRSLLQLC